MSYVAGALLVVLATACWSTSGTFINLILRSSDLTPWGLAFWRDLATFVCLFAGLAILRPGLLRVRRADLPWLAAAGSVGVGLMHIMWNTSVILNGVAVSTVIQCNAPIFVTLMAWRLWREPVTGRKMAAIALSFVGTILIARLYDLGGVHITMLGLLLSLGAAVTYGIMSLLAKKLVGTYSPLTVLVYAFGFATLVLIPFQASGPLPQGAIWDYRPLATTGAPAYRHLLVPVSPPPCENRGLPQLVGYFAGLVLLTTITGFLLYTIGLRRLPVSVASIVATTEVPFAAVLSFFTLGERLDAWQMVGAASVVGAVALLSWPQQMRSAVSSHQATPAAG